MLRRWKKPQAQKGGWGKRLAGRLSSLTHKQQPTTAVKIVYNNDDKDTRSAVTGNITSDSDASSSKSADDCGIELAASFDHNPTKAPAEALSDQLSLPYSMLWSLVLSQVSQQEVGEAMFQPLAKLQPQGQGQDGTVEAVYRQPSTVSTIPVENMSYQLGDLSEARSKSIRRNYGTDSEEDEEEKSNWSSSSCATSAWEEEEAARINRKIRQHAAAKAVARQEQEKRLSRQLHSNHKDRDHSRRAVEKKHISQPDGRKMRQTPPALTTCSKSIQRNKASPPVVIAPVLEYKEFSGVKEYTYRRPIQSGQYYEDVEERNFITGAPKPTRRYILKEDPKLANSRLKKFRASNYQGNKRAKTPRMRRRTKAVDPPEGPQQHRLVPPREQEHSVRQRTVPQKNTRSNKSNRQLHAKKLPMSKPTVDRYALKQRKFHTDVESEEEEQTSEASSVSSVVSRDFHHDGSITAYDHLDCEQTDARSHVSSVYYPFQDGMGCCRGVLFG